MVPGLIQNLKINNCYSSSSSSFSINTEKSYNNIGPYGFGYLDIIVTVSKEVLVEGEKPSQCSVGSKQNLKC